MESGTALGGSLSFYYTPEANALRLLTQARPSVVCSSALGPRAKVSQIEVGLMLLSSRHNPYARACAAILRGPATQPRLLWSGCWLSHSDWG